MAALPVHDKFFLTSLSLLLSKAVDVDCGLRHTPPGPGLQYHQMVQRFFKHAAESQWPNGMRCALGRMSSSRSMRGSVGGRRALPLTHKACEVLQYLIGHPGQLVTKEALVQAVWPETAVSDAVLTNRIAELRQALGDDAKRPRFIATVHRRGYRFVAALRTPAPAPSLATAPDDRARTIGMPTSQPALPVLVG